MSGMTNSEIAQARFVTRSTVEKHLSHAYEKLGIDSRGAGDGAVAAAPGWYHRRGPSWQDGPLSGALA
jgi:ATP/maltotriose-dependent transcriptional regulator MalT